MRIKKFMSVLLVMALMFSFCSFFVSAADDGAINTRDLDFSASVQVLNSAGTSTVQHDVTNDVTVDTTNAEVVKGYVRYTFPSSNYFDTKRTSASLVIFNDSKFNSSHEYNLKFNYAFNKPLAFSCIVSLRFKDNSGNFLKQQFLFQASHDKNQYNISHPVDIDFNLDTDGIDSGYKCELVISFVQDGYNSSDVQRFYVSPEIYLTDKDDDSGWFQKIIDAIHGIGDFFTDLGNSIYNNFTSLSLSISTKLSSLGDRISGFFTDLGNKIEDFFINLGENIGEFFTMLKNYILYFEHPVTLNSDGVLVDSSGNPIYTNPFASAMDKVKNTFNGWIGDIEQFVSNMEVSRKNVSNYISKGTSIINDVMSASPVLTACIIFVAGFLVIRKVVGR